jgi:hypothetical protein
MPKSEIPAPQHGVIVYAIGREQAHPLLNDPRGVCVLSVSFIGLKPWTTRQNESLSPLWTHLKESTKAIHNLTVSLLTADLSALLPICRQRLRWGGHVF